VTEPDFLGNTRDSYDTLAADYTRVIRGELAARPFDRAMLAAFAELVTDSGPVADIGCGPGRVTAHLRSLGVEAFGIDLSPEMIAMARREYPELRFEVGSLTDIRLADDSLGGVMAWYSVIHVPPALRPGVFAAFHRVLVPGGHVLLAFQVGDEVYHSTSAAGHTISLDFHRLPPDRIADELRAAGFVVQATMIREPKDYAQFAEKMPQAFLLATKPS
jgi:SAM-dependent methyltransferase